MIPERFDIQAVIPAEQTNEQIPEVLESLLQERFKMQVYRLVVAKGGAKLEKTDLADGLSGRSTKTSGRVTAQATLPGFAEYLSQKLDRPVVADAAGPSIFTSIQEQFGLRLAAAKTGVRVVVVDGSQRPQPTTESRSRTAVGESIAEPPPRNSEAAKHHFKSPPHVLKPRSNCGARLRPCRRASARRGTLRER